jgi:SAM-dependent methyltransferase
MARDLSTTYDALLDAPELSFDQWSRSNLENFRPRHELLLRALEEHGHGSRERIADVGCQNGFFLRMASEVGYRELIAVDAFTLPPERSFLTGLDGVQFVKANFNEAGFLSSVEDASVDCVVSTEVLEHLFNHPVGYLHEVWRVLRKGGLLLLSTPNPSTVASAIKLLRGKSPTWGDVTFAQVEKIAPGEKPAAFWDIHFREYAAEDLRGLVLELPGAEIIESGFVANAPSHIDSLLKRYAKRVVHRSGLSRRRLASATQFYVVRKSE